MFSLSHVDGVYVADVADLRQIDLITSCNYAAAHLSSEDMPVLFTRKQTIGRRPTRRLTQQPDNIDNEAMCIHNTISGFNERPILHLQWSSALFESVKIMVATNYIASVLFTAVLSLHLHSYTLYSCNTYIIRLQLEIFFQKIFRAIFGDIVLLTCQLLLKIIVLMVVVRLSCTYEYGVYNK